MKLHFLILLVPTKLTGRRVQETTRQTRSRNTDLVLGCDDNAHHRQCGSEYHITEYPIYIQGKQSGTYLELL